MNKYCQQEEGKAPDSELLGEKKLYFKFSDNTDVSGIILTLSLCMEWIENDTDNHTDETLYTLSPIWLTDEEFENLPEAEF